MLTKPTIEELLPKTENRYVLSMLTAKRARQLVDGALPMIQSKTENVVSFAAEEINENQIKAIKGKVEVKVPLRPEVEAERITAELEAEAKRRESRQGDGRRNYERPASDNTFQLSQSVTADEAFRKVMAEHLLNSDDQFESDDDYE